jgi:hypothetical protein
VSSFSKKQAVGTASIFLVFVNRLIILSASFELLMSIRFSTAFESYGFFIDVDDTNFEVVGSDPHGFDGDNDGIGCEDGNGDEDDDGADDEPEPEPEPGDGDGDGDDGGGGDEGSEPT